MQQTFSMLTTKFSENGWYYFHSPDTKNGPKAAYYIFLNAVNVLKFGTLYSIHFGRNFAFYTVVNKNI